MSRAATLIRNGVHPRKVVEMSLSLHEPTDELVADWTRPKPINTRPGYIDTRPPRTGNPARHTQSMPLDNGKHFGVWFAFQGRGATNRLLFTIKHPPNQPLVDEMDRLAAKQIGPALANALHPKPTMIIAVPSGAKQAEHFAQELGQVTKLPVRTGVFQKRSAAKNIPPKLRRSVLRRIFRIVDRAGIEGQSIILADDNVGTGESMAACAELLYANGAAFVHGAAVFKVSGGGPKNSDIEDIPLSFAQGFTDKPEQEAQQPDETDADTDFQDEDENRPLAYTLAQNLRHSLQREGVESLKEFTATQLADVFEVTPVQMRWSLKQLGLLGQVKPG